MAEDNGRKWRKRLRRIDRPMGLRGIKTKNPASITAVLDWERARKKRVKEAKKSAKRMKRIGKMYARQEEVKLKANQEYFDSLNLSPDDRRALHGRKGQKAQERASAKAIERTSDPEWIRENEKRKARRRRDMKLKRVRRYIKKGMKIIGPIGTAASLLDVESAGAGSDRVPPSALGKGDPKRYRKRLRRMK